MEILRDWDEELVPESSRVFKIGGELFEFVYPQWEVGAKVFNEELTPVQSENGDPPRFDWVENTKKAVDGVPQFLNPKNDALKRWKALCARKPPDAVPRHQISQLYNWLVQVTGNLPTTPPSSPLSDGGDGATEEKSSGATPSTEAT